jgi:hypothetical protein
MLLGDNKVITYQIRYILYLFLTAKSLLISGAMSSKKDKQPREDVSSVAIKSARSWRAFLVIVFGGVITYVLLLLNSPEPLQEHSHSAFSSQEQITIVMNTFKR